MKYKSFSLVGVSVLTTLALAGNVSAWGPERPTYTNNHPADHATYNSIVDNPVLGDERDFVRIVEFRDEGVENKNLYTNNIELEAGKKYEVFIYYHNNASATFNAPEHDFKGVAYNTKVITNFPDSLAAGEKAQVSAIVRSTSTDPEAVWDEANVTAKEAMTLHYVTGSAKLHNDWGANGSVMARSIFSQDGTYVGMNELNGMVFGCYEYSGYITYTIQTEPVTQPETPETPVEPTPETPTTPEVPEELPTTGPAEVVLAVVVVLAIVAGGFYWYKTHKAVRKVTKRAKGRK